jgi:hypothetical protein
MNDTAKSLPPLAGLPPVVVGFSVGLHPTSVVRSSSREARRRFIGQEFKSYAETIRALPLPQHAREDSADRVFVGASPTPAHEPVSKLPEETQRQRFRTHFELGCFHGSDRSKLIFGVEILEKILKIAKRSGMFLLLPSPTWRSLAPDWDGSEIR